MGPRQRGSEKKTATSEKVVHWARSLSHAMSELNSEVVADYGNNFRVLKRNNQTCELQTIIRDKNTSRRDFKFYADRLIRLVIEESLNQLPYTPCTVVTPIGCPYEGLRFEKGNCGVSIVRSGEAMEQGLRDCCRSIRIGKILVHSDHDTHEAQAVRVLKDHNVLEENIVLANLFCTPQATQTIVTAFPQMKILTSEIHPVAPNHFGQKYFGTD